MGNSFHKKEIYNYRQSTARKKDSELCYGKCVVYDGLSEKLEALLNLLQNLKQQDNSTLMAVLQALPNPTCHGK